jgi:hypothetical protein
MAMTRGLQVLQTDATFYDDEEAGRTVNERDVALMREQRAWADMFAKYVHGGYRSGDDKGKQGAEININIGVPAHVRARMGLDETEVTEIDHTLRKTEGLVDGL